MNSSLYIRKAESAFYTASSETEINVPARPIAPTLTIDNEVEGVTLASDYCYNTTGADYSTNTWTPGDGSNVPVTPRDSIYIYKAATASDFKSVVQTLTAPSRGTTPSVSIGEDYFATGAFSDENAGENKTVTVTAFLADNDKAGNYRLADSSFQTTGTICKSPGLMQREHIAIDEVQVAALLGGDAVEVLQLPDIVGGHPAVLPTDGIAVHPALVIAPKQTLQVELHKIGSFLPPWCGKRCGPSAPPARPSDLLAIGSSEAKPDEPTAKVVFLVLRLNLYQQQAAAKEEVGKAFPYEEELRVKNARLVELDMELNMDSKGQSRPEAAIAKRERPSVLEGLKRPIPPRSMEKKPRQQEQEAR